MNTIPDLLRLFAIPVFGWVAWRDYRTRRVPNRLWYPLAFLGIVLLLWDGWRVVGGPAYEARALFIRTAVSVGIVIPLAYGLWWFGGFGGADAKAFMVLALLFPTYPRYHVGGVTVPLESTTLGVFSLTILTNTVLIGLLYPVVLTVRNGLAGRFSGVMFVGWPLTWDAVMTAHGRLLETPDGFTRRGLDLDALRMYLRWRGLTLADIREYTARVRDPTSLPDEPNPPTDGAIDASDGATVSREPSLDTRADTDPERLSGIDDDTAAFSDDAARFDDPWGAAAFLDDIDHGAYGTTPTTLRSGLDLLATADMVWISPGIPFLVPMFVGLLVSLVYGDVLFGLLALLGFV